MKITHRQLRRIIREEMSLSPELMGGSDDDPMIAVYNKIAPVLYDFLQDEMSNPDSDLNTLEDPSVLQPAVKALRQLADDLEQRGRKNQRW